MFPGSPPRKRKCMENKIDLSDTESADLSSPRKRTKVGHTDTLMGLKLTEPPTKRRKISHQHQQAQSFVTQVLFFSFFFLKYYPFIGFCKIVFFSLVFCFWIRIIQAVTSKKKSFFLFCCLCRGPKNNLEVSESKALFGCTILAKMSKISIFVVRSSNRAHSIGFFQYFSKKKALVTSTGTGDTLLSAFCTRMPKNGRISWTFWPFSNFF